MNLFEQQAANRRRTWLIMIAFVAVLLLLGAGFDAFFVGAAGYYFQQLTGDSGDGATLGDFKGRVAGIGPQMGYIFPVSDTLQGAFSAKAYWEFAAQNRPEGWNMWVGFVLSPAAHKKE